MHRNPFVVGVPVDVHRFIGRQSEVDRLLQQITSPARGSVAIIGERRIGKTSLLHYVSAPAVLRRWEVDQESTVFLFIDCGSIAPLTITTFWQHILTHLRRQLARRPRASSLLPAVDALLAHAEIRTSDVEFLIEDLGDAGLVLMLLLDEFEWLVRTDPAWEEVTRDLLTGLRSLINRGSRALSLVVATRRPLDELCRDVRFMSSPFQNNFMYLHLRPFSRAEADSLLDRMLSGTGVVFSPADRALIGELAGTHPMLLQAAASCVFDRRAAAPGGELDRRFVLDHFMDLTAHLWQDLWNWSTAGEQDALMRIGRDPRDVRFLERRPDERRRLLDRGLLVAEDGHVRPFSPMLRHWLLERAAGQGRQRPTAAGGGRSMVFVSYSHKDEAEKEALLTQLRVLQSGADVVEVWSDDGIGGGESWEAALGKALDRARVAVLLVTANFLTSEFILRHEVPRLLRRREQEGVSVIPVIARPCAWDTVAWLKEMNARPKSGRPVWSSGGGTPDEALAAIVGEIAAIVTR